MKRSKIILTAVLLVGAGVASAQAGVSFGISGGDYQRSGYGGAHGIVQAAPSAPASAYVPSAPGYYGSGYSYGQVHGDHQHLHHDLKAERRALSFDRKQKREALHDALRAARYHGASKHELREIHKAGHYTLKQERRADEYYLKQQHRAGHHELAHH